MSKFAFNQSFGNMEKYHATKPTDNELLAPTIYYKYDSNHAKIFVRYIDYWNYIYFDWWNEDHPCPLCNYIILNNYKNIDEVLVIAQTDFETIDLYFDNTDEGKHYAIQFPLYLQDIEYQYKAHIGADPVIKTKAIKIFDRRKQYKGFDTLSDYLVVRYQQKPNLAQRRA